MAEQRHERGVRHDEEQRRVAANGGSGEDKVKNKQLNKAAVNAMGSDSQQPSLRRKHLLIGATDCDPADLLAIHRDLLVVRHLDVRACRLSDGAYGAAPRTNDAPRHLSGHKVIRRRLRDPCAAANRGAVCRPPRHACCRRSLLRDALLDKEHRHGIHNCACRCMYILDLPARCGTRYMKGSRHW